MPLCGCGRPGERAALENVCAKGMRVTSHLLDPFPNEKGQSGDFCAASYSGSSANSLPGMENLVVIIFLREGKEKKKKPTQNHID